MLGNTLFISRVEHDISFAALTREILCSTLEINYGTSAQPCIILYIYAS